MTKITNKQRFDMLKAHGLQKHTTYEQRVQHLVNILISSLFKPKKGYQDIIVPDNQRLKRFGVDNNEPINWGDLKCVEVKALKDDSFIVIVDEAEPGQCPSLCHYLESYMDSYGWKIEVKTEW